MIICLLQEKCIEQDHSVYFVDFTKEIWMPSSHMIAYRNDGEHQEGRGDTFAITNTGVRTGSHVFLYISVSNA